jgi:hypothetical protein
MNVDIGGTDSLVSEYLIFRGFTSTFQSLESELKSDRLKAFEVNSLVDSVFSALCNFEIGTFIRLWLAIFHSSLYQQNPALFFHSFLLKPFILLYSLIPPYSVLHSFYSSFLICSFICITFFKYREISRFNPPLYYSILHSCSIPLLRCTYLSFLLYSLTLLYSIPLYSDCITLL